MFLPHFSIFTIFCAIEAVLSRNFAIASCCRGLKLFCGNFAEFEPQYAQVLTSVVDDFGQFRGLVVS
jgi:hypothetical protein